MTHGTRPDELLDAEHPGEITAEEAIQGFGNERAQAWYNEAVWYAARLMVESAQTTDAVEYALLDDDTEHVMDTIYVHDPATGDKIDELGLSYFQGSSAENTAEDYLRGNWKGEAERRAEADPWHCEACGAEHRALPISDDLTITCPDCDATINDDLSEIVDDIVDGVNDQYE